MADTETVVPTIPVDESIDEIDAPEPAAPRTGRARRGRRRPIEHVFRLAALAYVFFLVLWPVGLLAAKTFSEGMEPVGDALTDPQVVHAFRLTVLVAVISVVINTVFGVGISLLLVRYRFPGRRILSAFIDLPLSVSPVVVGLALVLVYGGRGNWFGPSLERAGIQIIFATPGIVLATIFVSLPLVVRELVPVLEEIGTEQEQAARSLGANAWVSFWRITFPAIRWAMVYGVVLSLARSLGEYGAVKIVSGNFVNQTQTVTLVVEQKYGEFQQQTAYITSFFLAAVSVLCLVIVSVLRPKGDQR